MVASARRSLARLHVAGRIRGVNAAAIRNGRPLGVFPLRIVHPPGRKVKRKVKSPAILEPGNIFP